MADACLRNRVPYLDITSEIDVFEALAARDAEAKAQGVILLPVVGFDVVPSDNADCPTLPISNSICRSARTCHVEQPRP